MKVACLRATFGRRYVLSPVRVICHCLTGLVLLVISAASYAEGNVNPAVSTAAPPMIKYAGAYSNFDTPEAACADIVAHQWDYTSSTTLVYDHVEPYTANHLKCFARDSSQPTLGAGWYANVGIMRSCDGIGWANNETTCTKNVCPANSTGTPEANPTSCTCSTGYAPDVAKTSCVPVVTCPIDPLPGLPKDDLCAQSLEAGRGKDINNACSSKLLPEMQKQAQCLADKIHALDQPYTGPSATVRTAAYQQHLLEVWNKVIEIEDKELSDEQELACAAVIADAENEMDWHKIKSDPSNKGDAAPHVRGKAIDIPTDVVDALKARVSNTTFVTFTGCIFCIPIAITTIGDVQDYVNSATVNPPACNLKWGGRFKRIDDVHFQLP